jgi:hypothetical protein
VALVYPIANTAHVIGAIMVVGSIGVVDLRVLGYGRDLPMHRLSAALTPIALTGFAVMVLSGTILFVSDAPALARSPIFLTKLGLIALAGLNALAFRLGWRRLADDPPVGARVLAAGSLGLWLAVVVAGRLIAYF